MNSDSKTYYSNGKLLITAEYVVLDGALALALPTKQGQSLAVKRVNTQNITWKSIDEHSNTWFEDTFLLKDILLGVSQKDNSISKTLRHILHEANQLNPLFLSEKQGFEVVTHLDFPRHWGLGTSSTLINNIANWSHVDAYELLAKTFGGSGYDIACAQHKKAITYQLLDTRIVNEVDFNPSFKEQLYFVYLNKKQNSRDGIAHYKANAKQNSGAVFEITDITHQMLACNTSDVFEQLITAHEAIISKLIGLPPVKASLFNDFDGSIKSLGAWGGDFVMVVSKTNPEQYFKSKGLDVVIPFEKMIL